MIYVFGNIPIERAATDSLMEFIKNEPDGIFVLPEAFLLVNHADYAEMQQLTSGGKKTVIAGSNMIEYEKARVFAYGESDIVPEYLYDFDRVFNIPYNGRTVRTIVRVCSDLFKPYPPHTDVELICNPSSISLENLKNLDGLKSILSEENIIKRLGFTDVIIASSNYNSGGEIICASGQSVGTPQTLVYGIKCKTYDAIFN